MEVAVVGGTGSVGSLVVQELAARGDRPRIVSRRRPAVIAAGVEHRRADVRTGVGLAAALEGVEAVVDAINDTRAAQAVLVEGGRRLLAAEAEAGVRHHIAISIVGCDRTPVGYYRVKVAEEELVAGGPVPWSLLRATQFHTLIAWFFSAAARARVLPVGSARLQPVDPAIVARRLTDAVHAGPAGRLADIAGPEVRTLSELAADWRADAGQRALPLRIPFVGRAGRALRAGTLCAPQAAAGGPTFAQWLARQR